jgi:putative CocE/NonD family hydrolase
MTERSEIRDNMRIDWDVPITMDDGLVLRADIFRPVQEGKHPVILTYGPYAKGLAFQDGYPSAWERMVTKHPDVAANSSNLYQSWEVVDPEKWVPHGYACVRVDSRGAGCSPGFIDHFSPRETKDFYDCIEWAGGQPWSNGKVGLNGISYYGINQWHVASLQPPHLAAMCVWEGAADWYRDMTHHGGMVSTFWANWYDMQVKTVQYGAGERGKRSRVHGELVCGPETLTDEQLAANRCDFGADIRAHPLDDDYHKARSPQWDRINVPLFSAANWGGQGLHPRGNFEGFARAASRDKWLEAHGIEHWTHFYTDYGRELQRKFFDKFLKGEDTGWGRQPRVLLQVRHPGETFVERAEDEWPLARTQWTKFYLNSADFSLSPLPNPPPQAGEGEQDYFLNAANRAAPSGPADFSHSVAIALPTLAKPILSSGVGGSTMMPASLSALVLMVISSIDIFQPRSSATLAASVTAFFSAAESLSNASLFTITMLRGSQAWVSM